jgi:uncharacterized membrane protein YbhN (UPF0104 family)
MRRRLRQLWPCLKAVLGLAILVMVGRQLLRDLRRPELWEQPLAPGWLVLAGLLYLAGLSLSALYWHRLLLSLGSRPRLRTTLRAYFLGHLGKYLPGKAWAILLRGSVARDGGPSLGLAAGTAFYEVLVTMAAGTLLAALLFATLAPDRDLGINLDDLRQLLTLQPPAGGRIAGGTCLLLALLLLAPFAAVLHPALFNRVAGRLLRKEGVPPSLHLGHLGSGLLLTGCGWVLLGISLWSVLQSIPGMALPWSRSAALLPALLAVSYVAGFVVLIAPGGLGVREVLLAFFLTPHLVEHTGRDSAAAHASAELVALVLRLVWTTAELLLAALLYWTPASRAPLGGPP